MLDNTSGSGSPFRTRFQFSLVGLFVLVTATAIGLSMAAVGRHSWEEGVFAALCLPMVIGLWCQSQDFRRASFRLEGLSLRDRRSWRFEALGVR